MTVELDEERGAQVQQANTDPAAIDYTKKKQHCGNECEGCPFQLKGVDL